MQLLQITDPHLYGRSDAKLRGVETDSSLRMVLADAYLQVPDYAALLVTGDLVQDDPDGYARFRSIFESVWTPVLCIPGNHDEPEAMAHELSGAPFEICGSHAIGDWLLVMLDSYHPGHVGGLLAERELERLDESLGAARGRPAMVCLHHHPVAMGSHWLDGIGLQNSEEFWRVIDAHSHVRAVVWGHVHQEFESRRGGVRLYATPSTGAQFLPGSERYAVDMRPPAYRSFRLDAAGGIASEVHWVSALPLQRAASG